ncbi:hypothetical protein Trydic_g2087 [Trypoxylus dichotomus]
MKNIEILKIQNEDKSLMFRVKPEWNEDNFNLLILLENSSAYYANITQEHLQNSAEQHSQNVADYYNNIKVYLTQPNPDILFNLQQSDNFAEFFIKRKSNRRTLLFFSVKLTQVSFQESVFELIEALCERNAILSENLRISETKQTRLEEEKQTSLNQLAEFVELKENWEQQMYSSFLILLNEKKRRIQFLTDLLERKNIDPTEIPKKEKITDNRPESTKSPSTHKAIEAISESESSSEYETDNGKDDEIYSDYDDDNDDEEPTSSTSGRNLKIDDDPEPTLCLPKITMKSRGKQLPQKVKQSHELTPKILMDDTQSTQEVATQEPSTQELINRHEQSCCDTVSVNCVIRETKVKVYI